MKALECPECGKSISPLEFEEHLEKEHGIRTKSRKERQLKRVGTSTTYKKLGYYDWGDPIEVKDKEYISEDEKESASPEYGEVYKIALDESYHRIEFDEPKEVADEIKKKLKEQGLEPKYIEIKGGVARAQYRATKGDTLAIVTIAICAAVIAAAILAVYYGVIKDFSESVYKLIKKATPDWLEPVVMPVIIVGGGAVAALTILRLVSK